LKKVGILTFHNAENYGAALQTYALMKAVQELGCDCQVIDYRNRGVFLRNAIKNGYYFLTGQNPIKNHRAYRQFQRHYLNLSPKTYRRLSEFEKDADYYKILIFGSDQIWNPDLSHGFDPLYFGQFHTQAKKITYAASVGKDSLTREEREKLNQLIEGFDAVAVREENILPLINREATAVLDPCLLLSAEQWMEISDKDVPDNHYILVYQLHPKKSILETAKILAAKFGKKVLIISPYLIMKTHGILHKLGRITPNQFLSYYRHADIVLSDSFHGTIFSILFEKLFFTILPNEKTGRITSLLEKLNLSERIVRPNYLPTGQIDFKSVKITLSAEIDHSLTYLEKHLACH